MKDKTKILVVDDDDSMLLILKDVLESGGYYVITCSDGLEAVKILSQSKFHIVVTDLRMPNMDGKNLLSEIKKMNQSIEVIMVSGQGDIDAAVEIMKRGAYDFITKPIDFKKMLNIIKQCEEKYLLTSENLELKERVAFFEVSQALNSTLKLKELLDVIIKSIQKVIQADQGSIMLIDKKQEKLFIKASFGLEGVIKDKKDFDFSNGLAGKVLEMDKPQILIDESGGSPLLKGFKGHSKINSSLFAPLKVKNKTIGIINLARTKITTRFNESDLSLLTIFAEQTATAIENAYLYKKLKDYNEIIKQEKEEIEAIIKNISDGIVVCDFSNKIILFNSSFQNLFGLNENSIMNNSFHNILKKDKFSDISYFIQKFNKSKKDFEESKFYVNIRGEKLHLRVTIAKLKADNYKKERTMLSFQDLTRLVQAQKVAAWRGMARSLAHEVKNPLTPILWAAEAILEKNTQHSKPHQEFMEKKCNTIIREVSRLQALISDFSLFAKHPEPDLKPESIEMLLEETLSLYSKLRNIKTTMNFQEKFPLVSIDKNMMKQVFINIIQNAIDAMPEGGELSIEGRVFSLGVISISFKDTGIGIPDKIMENLFDPYFTTKKKGTGLGLTITSQIISDHHGHIRFISKEKQGTTVVIDLPML